MADICVVFLSDDRQVVRELVALLRKDWSLWWAGDIAPGDWETQVRHEIPKAKLLIPVFSAAAKGSRTNILKDEMKFAEEHGVAILPFVISKRAEIPMGFGGLHRVESVGWDGDRDDGGFVDLTENIVCHMRASQEPLAKHSRPKSLMLGEKVLQLPSFTFSLSSHETQVSPSDGAALLQGLLPGPMLISAYDVDRLYKSDRHFIRTIEAFKASGETLFLDSGNYEASRKSDHKNKQNPSGWNNKDFREIALAINPDIAFSYDKFPSSSDRASTVDAIVRHFIADDRALKNRSFPLCPIVHLPRSESAKIGEVAAEVMAGVAKELDPIMIAIPERELGDGITARVRSVMKIRSALNALGKYYPIHLLGTGNPLSMVSFAAAGADSFDGLEWCRTVADYDSGYLFHFQQFDCFHSARISRVQSRQVRQLMEDKDVPYTVRTLSYNTDFFADLAQTMHSMIHSGQIQNLLKMVPEIGRDIFQEISNGSN